MSAKTARDVMRFRQDDLAYKQIRFRANELMDDNAADVLNDVDCILEDIELTDETLRGQDQALAESWTELRRLLPEEAMQPEPWNDEDMRQAYEAGLRGMGTGLWTQWLNTRRHEKGGEHERIVKADSSPGEATEASGQ